MRVEQSLRLPEFELHHFVVEASTLGLAPGQWPASIETDMGNGQPFVLGVVMSDGTHIYQQALGCIALHVLND